MAEIDFGQLSEALNDKMDRDGNNIQSPRLPIFLVAKQDPSAENNYTWYRKWSDGWVEQGGNVSISSAGQTVSLPVTMADNNYTATASGGTQKFGNCAIYNKTTTGFAAWTSDDDSFNAGVLSWQVSGMAA